MSFTFKKTSAALMMSLAASAFAAEPSAKQTPAKSEQASMADQIIQKLESTGALDRAMDRAVERRIAKDQKERQHQAEDQMRQAALLSKNARPVSQARDHIYGNPKAEISIIVYSDLECPFCKRFNGVPEAAIKSFDSKVNMVWRNFPLPMHKEVARKEAIAADCVAKQAGNEGFFKFTNAVFSQTGLNGQGVPSGDEGLFSLARESGVKDEKAFDACMRDPKSLQALSEDLDDGAKAGVRGTPGTVIRVNKTGASTSLPGAVPQAQLEDALRQAINQQGPFAPTGKTAK